MKERWKSPSRCRERRKRNLIGDLGQLGTVHTIKPGFRDGDGNIVVVLKKK